MRVSVPRTSVSCVTRVSASCDGPVLALPARPARGVCTALRVSPLPRFCMLRGIAACCGRDARLRAPAGALAVLAALRPVVFAFAIVILLFSLTLFDGIEHPADLDDEIVRETRLGHKRVAARLFRAFR